MKSTLGCSWMLLLLLPAQAAGLAASKSSESLLRHQQRVTIGAGGRTEAKPANLKMMKNRYPFYHTSDELLAEAKRLSQTCGGDLTIKTELDESAGASGSPTELQVVTVRRANTKPVNRVFILFGEHSRELISPESGLAFLRVLCGDLNVTTPTLPGGFSRAQLLKDNEFQIVLNANPRSRRKVEAGDYCLRANPAGVDLNRNWDEHWTYEAARDDSNPGPTPFSEPETRILKRLVTNFKPTTFLTVHSGTRGMYMPWAYDKEHLGEYNRDSMMEMLRSMDKEHCKCPFGAAGREVGYPCPGTCLDYAYGELKTPFVFAFEIYGRPDIDEQLTERWQDKMRTGGASLLQRGSHLGHSHFRDFFKKYASDFVETGSPELINEDFDSLASKAEDSSEHEVDGWCFPTFNPATKEEYIKTIKNWAAVYTEMSVLAAAKLKSMQQSDDRLVAAKQRGAGPSRDPSSLASE